MELSIIHMVCQLIIGTVEGAGGLFSMPLCVPLLELMFSRCLSRAMLPIQTIGYQMEDPRNPIKDFTTIMILSA